LALACVLALGGCSRPLNQEYGRSHGNSLNGTQVFYDLLQARGHEVSRGYRLSSRSVERADALVVVHKQRAVDPLVAEGLVYWLTDEPKRVAIFVARDFDAAVQFWSDVRDHLRQQRDAELLVKAEERRTAALAALAAGPGVGADAAPCYPLCGASARAAPFFARLDPAYPLAAGVGLDTRLYLRRHPQAEERDRTLLSVAGAPFAVEKDVAGSRLLILANGAFVLNYMMVDAERRKLAVNLADRLRGRRRVSFFEGRDLSDAGALGSARGLLKLYNPFRFLRNPLFLFVILHWLVVGLVFLASRSQIFGRPLVPVERRPYRFSSHIAAYGELLERSADREYATDLVETHRTRDGTG